ncbi:MAG: hypothetical protein KAR20_08170, partial [Candidatus Heimdallarchaeota archaeon]|nr:hypothetical protein [Candidatus Heimdallarchaeota archaeon]
MDFSGGLTSAFLWLLSDRIIYAIFLLALFFILNFHVYPKLKQAKKMEDLFFDRLENMPLPQDFIDVCGKQKDDLVKMMEKMLENSNLKQENQIQQYMAQITGFYARLAEYEEWLKGLIQSVEILGGDVAFATSEIDKNIQTLLRIRTEMTRLMRNVIREAEQKGYLENIDPEPLAKVQQFLDASDKHFQAMYNDHAIDK